VALLAVTISTCTWPAFDAVLVFVSIFFFQLVSRLFSPSVSQTVVQFKRMQLHGFSSYLACFFVQLTHTTQNLGQRI